MTDGDVPKTNPGTDGYPSASPGYPESNSEGDVSAGESLGIDLSIYRDPREVARTNLIASDQPLAHLGLAGWAVERATGRAVWLSGETQWDVMKREFGALVRSPGRRTVRAISKTDGDEGGAMKAIQLTEFSGPEAMEYVDVADPEAGDGAVVVDVARCGVNFADTHVTRNDYLAKQELPLIPGAEVAGTTPDGRRVAAMLMNGGYAQKVAVPEAMLVPVPDGVTDDQAAAVLLQGLTAHALIHRCARLEPGETVVVEAAAGGTGSLAVQLAKAHGARVIGLASSPEKRDLVARLGADATADSRAEDLEAAILEANGGAKVDAVLEMAGGEAFEATMRTLAPFGRMVTFGIASREQNEVATGALMRTSRSVVGFWLMHLLADLPAVGKGIADLFGAVESGDLEVVIGGVRPLSEARAVHDELAARRTQGKMLLDPAL